MSDTEDTEQEMTELEKEFVEAQEKASKLIQEKLNEAMSALNEAEKISEQYGVPFYSYISPLSQTYTPATFEDKFGEIDREFFWSIGDGPGEYEGWQHSAVC